MNIESFIRKPFFTRCLAALTLVAVNALVMAEEVKPPDRLMEAAILAAHARQEIGCVSAEVWAKRAVATAQGYRSVDQAGRDTAGAFLAGTELLLEEARQRRKFLESESTEVAKLLSENRLESARQRIVEANPPSCDERLRHQRDEINARTTQARIRGAEAARMLQCDPKAALKLFEEVRSINAEFPGIDVQIAEAKGSAHRYRNWGGAARKVFLYSIAITATGAGAYFGYQEYRRSSMHNTAAR